LDSGNRHISLNVYHAQPSIKLVYLLVALEQFGYGLGTATYSIYLIYFSKEEYKTSHFAISTGLMALGMMLPGLISGYIQQKLGYTMFFILVFLLTIPGMLTLFFIPLKDKVSNYTNHSEDRVRV
jgi:PAT family beta-lactamase induction signal transducer AmpG